MTDLTAEILTGEAAELYARERDKCDRRRICQHFAGAGHGRTVWLEGPRPDGSYVALTLRPLEEYATHRVTTCDLLVTSSETTYHDDRCSAVRDVRDRCNLPSWWFPAMLAA